MDDAARKARDAWMDAPTTKAYALDLASDAWEAGWEYARLFSPAISNDEMDAMVVETSLAMVKAYVTELEAYALKLCANQRMPRRLREK